jgi:hypothetical protein
MPWLNPGIYYFYADNRVNCTTETGAALRTALGIAARRRPGASGPLRGVTTGKIGIVSYDVDWVYGMPRLSTGAPSVAFRLNQRPRSWAADAAVHFPTGP